MELKEIDYSRVTRLTHLRREAGQLYLPLAAAAFVSRYHFTKVPNQTEILNEPAKFEHGLFADTAIAEFSLYHDGIQVAARTRTVTLDAFIDDLLTWAKSEFGLEETGLPPDETHYESAVVISMNVDERKLAPYRDVILKPLNQYLTDYGTPFEFSIFGVTAAADQSKIPGRKPAAFSLARRINLPFEAGIYYSVAPLKTPDHLALLRELEEHLS